MIGLALLAVPAYDVWDDVTDLGWSVTATLAENTALFALSLALVAGGAWVATRDWEATYAETVARWTVGGALAIGGLFSLVILIQQQVMHATKPLVLALDGFVIGASVSFGTGLVRATQRRTGAELSRRERRERRLELVNRMLRHALVNDLNVVRAKGETLRDVVEASGDETAMRDLDVLTDRTAEMTEFVTTMRTLMDAVIEEERPALDAVSLRDVLTEQRDAMSDAAPSATVELTAPPDPEWEVYGGRLLDEVFENLLRNAIQHSDRSNPTVEVAAERTRHDGAPAVCVTVADDGPGVPEEEKRRVLEKGVSSGSPGGGFGLYLVSELVDINGGTVDVRDNDPRGTVVAVTLPLAE